MKQILNLSPSEDDILKIRRKLQEYNSLVYIQKGYPLINERYFMEKTLN
ncbi:hypothetical protein GH851_31605, partial [Bacillus thuringiensis]|nr:hypothetical protein [Bacillus thuringiensis]